MECLKIYSYSSCGAASSHGVDIETVVDVAAADQDNDEIRYGSWKFVFADYVTVGESEGSGCYCCETVAMVLVCNDCCCYCLTKRAPVRALGQ